MCDWGRFLKGGKGTWPYPFETKNNTEKMLAALPYYDAAHLLKGSKSKIVAEIGLIDFTCSAEAVYAAINQAVGEKILLPVPYRAHHLTQIRYKDQWDKQVALPKEAFIRDFLE
jgi:cephalosporin-C deacetylase-like acetyl esterase